MALLKLQGLVIREAEMLSAEELVMGELFQPTHLLVLAFCAIVLFGARRLPELGKGLGEGLKGFKDGLKNAGNEPAPTALQTAEPAHVQSLPVEHN
jgi:sec-independent protein translocase protein TatA